MTIHELTKARFELAGRRDNLQTEYIETITKARTYYQEHLLPAEKSATISNEEMNAIYDTYESLRVAEILLEKQIDIANEAIWALSKAEAALTLAKTEGLWREG